ncbi:HIT family protein [Pseudothauera rhizosphaerae]|uniref:HIT family protein n=1 Tax=Pseudothauera rhizosphaerae TaxID=2565932 RepID=A0A4S4AP13_9RHOO|nr:HIT family protein [Pseudothauera rhizosphaerae]THF60159.1 HIT family protein [Pseudothauera rhizosphaerae]
MTCPLCAGTDESVIWEDSLCRVIAVADADYPGFCRVVWHEHVAEMSDLAPPLQRHLFNVVMATEIALREAMRPDKINLASFGNVVPHLHWHVIPRFADDRHFPQSVWGAPQRDGVPRSAPDPAELGEAVRRTLAELTAG